MEDGFRATNIVTLPVYCSTAPPPDTTNLAPVGTLPICEDRIYLISSRATHFPLIPHKFGIKLGWPITLHNMAELTWPIPSGKKCADIHV